MTTWITICDTCKRDGRAETGAAQTDGETLASLVESSLERQPRHGVRSRRVSCLMGCTHGCNVAVQAAGKLCYTLGRFEATTEAATGIAEYAALHAASENGQVPFRQWPPAVKGHFITRHPPLPDAAG